MLEIQFLMIAKNLPSVFPLSSLFFLFLLSSCLPPASAPLATATSQPTVMASAEFCIAQKAPWSCTCGDLSNGHIEISSADRPGWCHVAVPLASHKIDGYAIDLPEAWFCRIAGAGANNLLCLTKQGKRLFVQSLTSDLALENADEAGIRNEQEGESYFLYPVVEANEERISKEVRAIGGRQALRLLTRQDGSFVLRYFVKNDDNLYVFTADGEETTDLLEEIIQSLQSAP